MGFLYNTLVCKLVYKPEAWVDKPACRSIKNVYEQAWPVDWTFWDTSVAELIQAIKI